MSIITNATSVSHKRTHFQDPDENKQESNKRYHPDPSRSYALRSRISSEDLIMDTNPPSPEPEEDRSEQLYDFFWKLVARIQRQPTHGGALGRKWALKVDIAADQLIDKPTSLFTKAYRAMNRDRLTRIIRERVLANYMKNHVKPLTQKNPSHESSRA